MKFLPRLLDDYRETRPDGGSFSPGVAWKSIETFYRDWLAARYEDLSAGPKDARVRVGQAHTVVTFAMRYVGKEHQFPLFGLDDKVRTLAFGYVFSETEIATSDLTERRCETAERYASRTASRWAPDSPKRQTIVPLRLRPDDALTQRIIETDTLIAEECAEIYERFIRLVEHIQDRRRIALTPASPDNLDQQEPDETPAFMLSLKMSFHGQKISEWFKWLSRS